MKSSTEMDKPKQKHSTGTSTRAAPLHPCSKNKAKPQTATRPVSKRKHKKRQYITRSKYELITKPQEQSPDLELPTFSSNVTIGDFLRNLNLYPCRNPLKSTLVSNSSTNEGEASPSKIAKTTKNSHTNTKVHDNPSVIDMDDINVIKDAETASFEMTRDSEQLTMSPKSNQTKMTTTDTMPEEPSGNLSIPIKYELIHNYSKFPVILNLLSVEATSSSSAEPSKSNHSQSPSNKPCGSPRPIRQSNNSQSSPTNNPCDSPKPIRQSNNSQSSPTTMLSDSPRPISQSDPNEQSHNSPTNKPCDSPRTPTDKIEATVTSKRIQNDGLISIGGIKNIIPPKASKNTNAGFTTPLGKLLITPKSKVKPNAFPALEEMITASKTPGSVLHSILEQLKEMAKEEESTSLEADHSEASKEPKNLANHTVDQPMSPVKVEAVRSIPFDSNSIGNHCTDLKIPTSPIKVDVVPTSPIKENVVPISPIKENVVPISPIKENVVSHSSIREHVVPHSPFKENVVQPSPIKEDMVQPSPIKEDVVPTSAIKENVVSHSTIKKDVVPPSPIKENVSPIKEDVVQPSPIKEGMVPPSPIKEDMVPTSPIKKDVVPASPIKEDVVPLSRVKENVVPTSSIKEHVVNTKEAPVNQPNRGADAPKCVKINFKSLSTNVQGLNSNRVPTSEKTEKTETQALLDHPIKIDQAEESPDLEIREDTATQTLPINSRPEPTEDHDYTIINLEAEATSVPLENLGETFAIVENEPVSTSLEEASPNPDEPEEVFDPSIEIDQAEDLEIKEEDTTKDLSTSSRPNDCGKSFVEDDYTIVKLEGEATSYPIEIFGETFIVVKNAEDDLTSQNGTSTNEQFKLEKTESCADLSTCDNDQHPTATYQSSGVSENVADSDNQGLNTAETSDDHDKSERNLFSVFNLLPSPKTTTKTGNQHLGSFSDDSQDDSDQDIWPEDRLKGSPNDIKIAFQTLISEVETLGPNVFINSKELFRVRAQDEPNCPKPVLCPLCNIPFQFSSHVREHVSCHFDAKPFKCPHCPKSFRRKNGGLTKHLLTHTNELPYICKICKKGFSQKSYLDQHQTCHIDDKPFNCELCGRAFKKKCHVRAHMMCFHTDYRPFICSICGKRYKLNNHLVQHMKTHTDERNYSCAHCSKTFQAAVILKRHMKLHSGEKPFECDVCGKSFIERGNLVRHLRRVCKRKMEDRKFKCEYCDKRFLQRIHRTEHMRIHTDEIPFWCTLCGKGFKTFGNRKAHYTWHVKKQDIDNVKVLEETDALIDAQNRKIKNKDTGMHLPTRPRECKIMGSSKCSKDGDRDDDADDNDGDADDNEDDVDDNDDDVDDNDDDDYDENNDDDDDDQE